MDIKDLAKGLFEAYVRTGTLAAWILSFVLWITVVGMWWHGEAVPSGLFNLAVMSLLTGIAGSSILAFIWARGAESDLLL